MRLRRGGKERQGNTVSESNGSKEGTNAPVTPCSRGTCSSLHCTVHRYTTQQLPCYMSTFQPTCSCRRVPLPPLSALAGARPCLPDSLPASPSPAAPPPHLPALQLQPDRRPGRQWLEPAPPAAAPRGHIPGRLTPHSSPRRSQWPHPSHLPGGAGVPAARGLPQRHGGVEGVRD